MILRVLGSMFFLIGFDMVSGSIGLDEYCR